MFLVQSVKQYCGETISRVFWPRGLVSSPSNASCTIRWYMSLMCLNRCTKHLQLVDQWVPFVVVESFPIGWVVDTNPRLIDLVPFDPLICLAAKGDDGTGL